MFISVCVQTAQTVFVSAPVLVYTSFDEDLVLETDASVMGLRVALRHRFSLMISTPYILLLLAMRYPHQNVFMASQTWRCWNTVSFSLLALRLCALNDNLSHSNEGCFRLAQPINVSCLMVDK